MGHLEQQLPTEERCSCFLIDHLPPSPRLFSTTFHLSKALHALYLGWKGRERAALGGNVQGQIIYSYGREKGAGVGRGWFRCPSAAFSAGWLARVMIIQFCMLNNRCQTEERDEVFAFLLLRTLLPQCSHFFSCHGSGNRSLSFSHACCMLMWNQFRGKKGPRTSDCRRAGDVGAAVACRPSHHPRLPADGASYGEQKFLFACLLMCQLQRSATGLLKLYPQVAKASWPLPLLKRNCEEQKSCRW